MKWLLVSLAFVLSACAMYRPKAYTFERERDVVKDASAIMKDVVRWCEQNQFTTYVFDQTLLTARSSLVKLQQTSYDSWSGLTAENPVADCGSTIAGPWIAVHGTLTVTTTPTTTIGKTRVTVSFVSYTTQGPYRQCVSMGIVEKAVLDAAAL